jgi:multiple antibiotic resistance protein
MQTYALEIFSVFMVLFAIINVFGSLPVILDFKKQGIVVDPLKTTIIVIVILYSFLFGGELVLRLFGVNISSFAVAGSIVIFFLSLEMVLGLHIFNYETSSDATIIPIAFPLIAGPGSITTLISLRSEYSLLAISIALALNTIIIFITLKLAEKITKYLGTTGIYLMKKFFGIILLAISVKLFVSNIGSILIK